MSQSPIPPDPHYTSDFLDEPFGICEASSCQSVYVRVTELRDVELKGKTLTLCDTCFEDLFGLPHD